MIRMNTRTRRHKLEVVEINKWFDVQDRQLAIFKLGRPIAYFLMLWAVRSQEQEKTVKALMTCLWLCEGEALRTAIKGLVPPGLDFNSVFPLEVRMPHPQTWVQTARSTRSKPNVPRP